MSLSVQYVNLHSLGFWAIFVQEQMEPIGEHTITSPGRWKTSACRSRLLNNSRNCGRMEWICLDWNQNALKVYRSIGAIPMDEWTVQRLDEGALKRFAEED